MFYPFDNVSWYQVVGFSILLAIITYLGWGILGMYHGYQRARSLGVPIIFCPVQPLNILWALTSFLLLPLGQKYLPFGLGHYLNYGTIDWPYRDRYRSHEKYGDAFVIVNPQWISLCVSDAAAIDEIMSRRKEFTKPAMWYGSMEIFGPNVDTVEGSTWQRHRKITTPPFNERNSKLVWKESLRQAGEMQDAWFEDNKKPITSTAADTLTLALHVLTGAGFGQQYSFKTGTQTLPEKHLMSYRDALDEVLKNIIFVIVFRRDILNSAWVPKKLRKIGLAITEFESYMREMIEHERRLIDNRESDSANLISSLIRSSEEGRAAKEFLSDDEILGNLFIYNLAGHETTANTLAYAITLLSVNPSLQDWLHEELVRVLGPASSPTDWPYEEAFPKLKRTLAIMLETLRLYNPVAALSKVNATSESLPLTIAGKQYQIPPGVFVIVNTMAAHTLPKHWGSDSLSWNPKRWIAASSSSPSSSSVSEPAPAASAAANSSGNKAEQEEGETIHDPSPKGAYKPWSEGPRVCPGKKFAQVEFVAVMATLFRDWTVRPLVLQEKGESEEEARDRVLRVVEDSKVTITLQMQKPETVGLVWKRR